MIVEAHLLHWQEKDIMPLVIKHYKSFCDEIIIHDNHSKDGSAELAKELGCTVIPFGSNFFDDEINRDLKNQCWKGSKADWVIVADFDEVFHDGSVNTTEMRELLGYNKSIGMTIFKTIGWQVMSDKMPPDECLLCETNGYIFENYSKKVCFDPQAIKEINYGLGAHDCSPVGTVEWNDGYFYVLHYKHIGGVQRTIDRYNQYKPRMSKFNRRHGHGSHYNRSVPSLKQEWAERMAKSHPLI